MAVVPNSGPIATGPGESKARALSAQDGPIDGPPALQRAPKIREVTACEREEKIMEVNVFFSAKFIMHSRHF